ncbi:ammonium transporter [bacterium]|nr:ammonium transporter [bacterium]
MRLWVSLLSLFAASLFAWPAMAADGLDKADTAWMMISSILVLMMIVPGLALFYGGLVKRDNVLATLMQTFAVCCIVSVLWPVFGYSLAFTEGNSFIGSAGKILLQGVTPASLTGTIPETVFIFFQLTFAAITCALLIGAVADRIKFSAVCLFTPLWLLFVYVPIAHWVWGPGGFIGGAGLSDFAGVLGFGSALDFAGGTVVHINSGIAGLVAALVLGKRLHDQEDSTSNNLVFSLTGAALLWVGWFGFNAGSALTAGTSAGMAMLVTNSAAGMAAVAWCGMEWFKRGKPSVDGAIAGVVSGLVAITPASGFVGFGASLIIGALSGVGCYAGVHWLKKKLSFDDSLDVFGIHGVGGIIGALLTGVFASEAIGGKAGWIEGNWHQFAAQSLSVVIVAVYSAAFTWIILKLVDQLVGLRVEAEVERDGLDLNLHGNALPDIVAIAAAPPKRTRKPSSK